MALVLAVTVGKYTSSGRSASGSPDDPTPNPRHVGVSISADAEAFTPARLVVGQHDIVKITCHSTDIAHSSMIDAYRIAKRAGAGRTVVFEFHANQAGTFPIYCNLAADSRCRRIRAELHVRPATTDDEIH